ncbi:MAG: hypothetical protein LBM70_02300 [Victivallales bacterium]|jgi:hypothetical protein|nr:hypothetical protein [Victivallales bacterium]
MFFLRFFAFLAFLTLFLTGCANFSDQKSTIVHATPMADASTMNRRAKELAQAIAPCQVRALAFYPEKLAQRHYFAEKELIAFIKECGFNRLYIYFVSPESLKIAKLSLLLEAAFESKIPVEAVLPESCYVIGRRGNSFIRPFVSGGTSLDDMLKNLRKFESKRFKFAGVTVLAQPHLFTAGNPQRPKQLVYAWSNATFGANLDNDKIMHMTLQKLAAFRAKLSPTPFTVGVPDFYEELVREGKLSCGSIADFEKIADKVMICNTGNKPSEAVETVLNELKVAGSDSLLISITLAGHTSVTAGALRRRNWSDFIRSLSYGVKEYKRFPAFSGVVLGPFSQIETLHQEK